jgi:6-phosphogluconolactonase
MEEAEMFRRRRVHRALLMAAVVAVAMVPVVPAGATGGSGAIYTISNDPSGNALVVFDRASDGGLTPAGEIATGGLGNGSGLGSQGAVALSGDGRRIAAVNPGSDQVSAFRVGRGGPVLASTVASGGDLPISVAIHGGLAYVLNAGGEGNVTGFRFRPDGMLTAIAGSTRPLSGAAVGPAQVEFSDDGRFLLVTEKTTSQIVIYPVRRDGRLGAALVHLSAGETPFGFSVSGSTVVVSEAFGGAADASAVSSYRLGPHGRLTPLSASVGTTETAACWIAITPNGRFAYTTNTGSDSVTGYRIGSGGSLTILNADGVTATTGDVPIDMAVSADGSFLYTLDSGSDQISGFAIQPDGSLTPLGTVATPAPAAGLVGR